MSGLELKEWVGLLKDVLLGLAAIVTIFVGVYGVKSWKRDIVGKEVYAAARNLVKESHLVYKAAQALRKPLMAHEKRQFTNEEIKHTTKNERWRICEVEGYIERIGRFMDDVAKFEAAKLELRVLVGTRIYEGYLPFGRFLTESLNCVNAYLILIQDESVFYFPSSKEVIESQRKLYPSDNFDDELSQNLADSRERGEVSLLAYLHRKSIYS